MMDEWPDLVSFPQWICDTLYEAFYLVIYFNPYRTRIQPSVKINFEVDFVLKVSSHGKDQHTIPYIHHGLLPKSTSKLILFRMKILNGLCVFLCVQINMEKPFVVKLEYVLQHAVKSDIYQAVFENRPRKWKFGIRNYGDIRPVHENTRHLINRSDGDPWDIFAPGIRELPTGKYYKIKEVVGMLRLENGNHKLAVLLYVPGFDYTRAMYDIRNYCNRYLHELRRKGSWVAFNPRYEFS